LLLTAVAVGFTLPVVSLLNPLLAREHGWGARASGLVAGGQALGMIVMALVVMRRGTLNRIGIGAALGLCVTALGIATVAFAPVSGMAVAGGLVLGTGAGTFACHIGPLLLTSAPDTHLSRVQALVTLVQSVALLVANNVLGALAEADGPTLATTVCAVAVAVAGMSALASHPLRHLRRN
jgi:MFS family permease